MFNTWNSIHPDQVKEVIDYANQVRFGLDNEKVKEDSILMTKEWEDELKDMPFFSKQKGRFVALLKRKSKVGVI